MPEQQAQSILTTHAGGPNRWKDCMIISEELQSSVRTKFVDFADVKKEPTLAEPEWEIAGLSRPSQNITLWEGAR